MNIKTATLHGIKWIAINAIGGKIFQFILGIVLARLLSPEDFGIVGMTAVFFALAWILIDCGLGTALIHKQNATQEDKSTVFFFNIAVSILCALVLCFFSKQIALYLNASILSNIIKVCALSMVISSFGQVHFALLTKDVNFKTPALISLPIGFISGVFGIILAYCGMGPWSLVYSSLLSTTLSTITVWMIFSWRPSFVFSIKSFKEFFAYGGNLTINAIFDKFFNEGIGMIIGKYYTPEQLGYYSKGQNTAQLPSTFLYAMVGNVTFPVLSKIQDDDETLMRVYGKFMRTLSLIIFFVMMLIVSLARPLTILLYSVKWESAIIFLQLFCLNFMFYHVHAINWNLLLVKGETGWAFKKEILNKSFKIVLIIIALPYGPVAICVSLLVSCIFDLFINTIVAGKLFDFGMKKQFQDFMPYLLMSIICCIPSFIISDLHILEIYKIVVGGLLASILYFGILLLRKDESLMFLLRLTPLRKQP